MNILYVAIVSLGLILLGNSQPKIALSLAALVLFGTLILNANLYQSLLGITPSGSSGSGRAGSSGAGRS